MVGGLEPLPGCSLGLRKGEDHLAIGVAGVVGRAQGLEDRGGNPGGVVVARDPGAALHTLPVADGAALFKNQPVGRGLSDQFLAGSAGTQSNAFLRPGHAVPRLPDLPDLHKIYAKTGVKQPHMRTSEAGRRL